MSGGTVVGPVIPRTVVGDVVSAVAFLRDAFGAVGEVQGGRPVEVELGSSAVMVSEAGERAPFPAFLDDDADAVFERAIAAGARCVEPPADTTYGDRRAMVEDPSGNVFQVAHRRGAEPDPR